MRRSFKYRIYPNKAQQAELQKIFSFCTFLYNSALQERISFYKKYKKSISYVFQAASLKEIKNEFKDQTENIYSQTLQYVLKKLDSSYKNFFNRLSKKAVKKGFPRYKRNNSSICFPQCDLKLGGVKLLSNGKLKVFGLSGNVKIKTHRPLYGRCKQQQS